MGILRRLLIIDDQRDFARLVGAVAERIGFTTRILHHTLDFEYVMRNWDPDVVAIQMERPDQQEIEILQYLERIKYPGRLLMTGDVKRNTLEDAARIAGENRPNVASVLTKSSSNNEIEAALKRLFDLESAA
jgi:DNA-binding NtrC family response regulator